MSQFGVIFSSFDFQEGPVVVFNKNSDDDLAKKISFKVIYAAMSGHTSTRAESFITGESIIPFPEANKIVFSYIFPFVDPSLEGDNIRASSISVITNSEENMFLYQAAPRLLKLSKSLASKIQDLFSFSSPISSELVKQFDEIDILLTTLKKESIIAEMNEKEESKETSLSIFKDYIESGIDRVLEAVLTFKQVVVVAPDQTIAKLTANTLTLFSPHRPLKIEYWTTNYTKESDIICGPAELKSFVNPFISNVIINLVDKTIVGGDANDFLNQFMRDVFAKKLTADQVRDRMTSYLDKWLVDVGMFLSSMTEFLEKPTDKNKDSVKKLYAGLKSRYSDAEMNIISQLMMMRNKILTLRAKELLVVNKNTIDLLKYDIVDLIGPVGEIFVAGALEKEGFNENNCPPGKINDLLNHIIEEIKATGVLKNEDLDRKKMEIMRNIDNFFKQLSQAFL